MAERRNWTNEELLTALRLYFELEFGQFHSKHPKIIEVAQRIGRTPGSVAMKLGNFASLDPAMMGKGLKSASKADAAIMEQFLLSPEEMFIEAEKAYAKVMTGTKPDGFYEEAAEFIYDFNTERETERLATVKSRLLQNRFRSAVVSSYNFKCAVCQINIPDLLIASHIIPWAENKRLRLHPTNGIALCGTHDKAFDGGYFSLENDCSIILSPDIDGYKDSEFVDLLFIQFEKRKLHMPFRFAPDADCLTWHRENKLRR